MNQLKPDLRFPKPPFRIDQSLGSASPSTGVLSDYLERIYSWRSAVIHFIESDQMAPGIDGLTQNARAELHTLLRTDWSPAMNAYRERCVYKICPFPQLIHTARANAEILDQVLAILRWRAGAEDYFSDIWDVFDPHLDLKECSACSNFLHPVAKERLCLFCLSEFAAEDLPPERHNCLLLAGVRAKWPPLPLQFLAWARK